MWKKSHQLEVEYVQLLCMIYTGEQNSLVFLHVAMQSLDVCLLTSSVDNLDIWIICHSFSCHHYTLPLGNGSIGCLIYTW